MGKTITIKEIAEKAEVSPGTVDRVIHNRGEVSEKTREKVLKIIKEGNYEPNVFARNLVLNRTFTIASLLPQHDSNSYWTGPYHGVQKAAQELKMLGIKNNFFLFDEEDPLGFERLALSIVAEKPDGILLAPVINTKAIWLTEICKKENIPLIVIDSQLPNSDKFTFIGQNAFKSGYLAGKLMDFANHSQSIHLILIKTSTDNNTVLRQRIEGFTAYYQDQRKEVRIVQSEFQVEDPSLGKKLQELVKPLTNKDKIFVPNSKVYHVARAIKSLGKSDELKLIGYDLIKKNTECLKNGSIDFLINQKSEEQGYMGIQLLYKHLVLKQEIKKVVYMPIEIVAKENLEFIT